VACKDFRRAATDGQGEIMECVRQVRFPGTNGHRRRREWIHQ
jgi:hypothetical protein